MQKKNTSNTKKLGLLGLVTVATLGTTALANAETYTVQKGDTLSAIAKKNGTTVSWCSGQIPCRRMLFRTE